MTLTAQIKNTIIQIPEGKTFRYSDLPINREEYVNAAKVLERLQKESLIKKLSKGVFYKPKKTVFGELKPDYSEQLKPLLYEGNKRVSYETGIALYNRLGLTTQVAFRTKIASKTRRNAVERGLIKAETVKSYVEVTEDNYPLLGLLDALKDIKTIPDTTVANSIRVLAGILKELSEIEIDEITGYALYYPPRVRSLLGALLESIQTQDLALNKLRNSLNPFTKVKLGLSDKDLPTLKKWNIQ